MTRVSKKIHAETLPIFYGNIHITSYHQRGNIDWEEVYLNFLKWIRQIGETNAGMLYRATVEYDFWAKCGTKERKKVIYEIMKRLGVEVDREGVLEIVTPLVWWMPLDFTLLQDIACVSWLDLYRRLGLLMKASVGGREAHPGLME